jgi:hypothetical protein
MNLLIILFLLSNFSFSQSRTNLFKASVLPDKSESINKKEKTKEKSKPKTEIRNLPLEYRYNNHFVIEESPIVVPTGKMGIKFKDLRPGDLTTATIKESVFAFQDSKAPVRAIITSGPLKGSIFIGEANLEKNSKRILIEFKKFRDPNIKDNYSVIASAMDSKGILGLSGTVISNEESYFAAEVIAAGAAGYADSTIQRDQNAFGNSVDNRSTDTFAKKAIVAGLSKTAERFSEKLKQAPEYSVLEGPIQIQILILEQPTITQ